VDAVVGALNATLATKNAEASAMSSQEEAGHFRCSL
jgi:hypothetical protein